MDIIFVDAFQQSSVISFPIGINLLSTIVNANSNYTSEVVSFSNLLAEKKVPDNILIEKNYETITNYILRKNPKIISFYTMGSSFFISLIIAKNIKTINAEIKIVFAGPHVSLCGPKTLETFDFIDVVAIGEGEQNVISIIDFFNDKEKIENVKGICYRKSNQIVFNEPTPLLDNLDDLPMLNLKMDNLPSTIPIETGRGCPYNCTFCCTKTFWKRKVRLKSTDRIINEIKHYMKNYGIRKFDFIHDLFTASKKNILEFCSKLIDLDIGIKWNCSARADTLDEEIIRLMAKSGCYKILLGIETGSQRMQSVINKHLTISEVKNTIQLLDKYGIEMQVNFIYGLPTEKEEDLIESLKLIRFCVEEMQIQETTIHRCMCFPGTHIYLTEKDTLTFNEKNFYLFKYPAKNHIDFIKRYPDLFSNLFTLDSILLDKYFYLDIFVNYVYNYFAFRTPKTIKEIIAYYNNSLLEFYLDYESELERMTALLTRTVYYEDNLSDVREEMYRSLVFFIKNKMKNDFILELLKFEEEIMKTVLAENTNESQAKSFDYDMLLYYQSLKKKKEKCKLLFTVTKNKEVKIYREI